MERSHLTRQIFHRILTNQPILHRHCLRLRTTSTRRHLSSSTTTTTIITPNPRPTPNPSSPRCPRHTPPALHQQHHRTFFNFNIFTKRPDTREADLDPGVEKMSELAKRQRMRARLPPTQEIAEAFNRFFRFRCFKRKREAITDTQAQLALGSLRYLIESHDEAMRKEGGEGGNRGGGAGVGNESRSIFNRLGVASGMTTKVLRFELERPSEAHLELARLLYEMSDSRTALNKSVVTYIYHLTKSGATQTARDVLLRYEAQMRTSAFTPQTKESELLDDVEEGDQVEESGMDAESKTADNSSFGASGKAWKMVLEGFLREKNEVEVERTYNMICERGIDNVRAISGVMLSFALQQADLAGVTQWWKTLRRQELESTKDEPAFAKETSNVLIWCLERGELQTGHEIVRELMRENPPKELWDAMFVWAAGTKKSVDEIGRMMTVMEKSNANIPDPSHWRVPDIATINDLVEFAISRNDPYMAERFIALGRERQIEPDARTLVLQMDYRLRVNDVDGALIAYKNLQSHDISANTDVPTVNRLIVALCQTNRHDFDTIMNVVADLSDRRVRFDAPTVAHLSLLHLSRDEADDVVDLLNTHAFHFSSAERDSIRAALLDFALDPATPTSRAWSTYTILHASFDETPRTERTALLTSFLSAERRRPDMAVRIFQHMRAHASRPDTQPTGETYIAALLGLATLRDLENLETLHNLLKLDPTISRTTRLLNALSLAYTACGRPRAALEFWDAAVASREGPSEASIHAALRACERAPWGDVRARDIWALLARRGVETAGNQALWGSYVAALAGNGNVGAAVAVLERGVEEGEVVVDGFVMGSLMAGAGRAGAEKQAEVEGWARERWGVVWGELEGLGWDGEAEGEELAGVREPRIDRRLGP